jgi:hypothetical protein
MTGVVIGWRRGEVPLRHPNSPLTEHEQEVAALRSAASWSHWTAPRHAEIVLTSEDGELPPVSLPPNSLRLIAQVLGL